MKHSKAFTALYLISALAANCRAQLSGSDGSVLGQSGAGSLASNREQQCAGGGIGHQRDDRGISSIKPR